MKRSGLKPVRHKIKPQSDENLRYQEEFQKMRLEVIARDKQCVRCSSPANHVHHIKPRSSGGKNTLENLILVCNRCHDLIHSDPRLATLCGYLA